MQVSRVAKRGCGTCRDRKILCDRGKPPCLQCTRSKRKCKGYGLRLSWPSAGDDRRGIVLNQQSWHEVTISDSFTSYEHLVRIYSRDVELHYHLTASLSARPTLRIPMPWNPSILEAGGPDLFQYFQSAASQSLAIFGHDPAHLGSILMRIGLTGNSPSSSAVVYALLAHSSLHRYGVQEQAFKLKISSLKALAAASTSELSATEAIQHVAAGMLLCSFEVHQSSCTSSQWTWYINGVKEVLRATCPRQYRKDKEVIALMDWVYYHNVMARFTMRHWSGEAAELPWNPSNVWPEGITQVPPSKTRMPVGDCVSRAEQSTLTTLHLLSELCDAVSTRPHFAAMTAEELEDYKSFLRVLDWRCRSNAIDPHSKETPGMTTVEELYRLATLVYLHRASGDALGQPARTQQYIDKGLILFSQLAACERQFPVFILGSEARTDEERAIVLDLVSRTEKKSSSRSLNHVKMLLQAVWAQDDLADGELDYWDKMSTIISCCSIVPSLV
ncbi:hypothetical protein K458DRAFT_370106 [Lentithecium fluviatile CBS 122367]|uniref:Zn(2)-C6 fungal-type domain-containing protein n=1 Tax=Lentithecium fluviatile CBS 122367 TaxID=1168545 RepID=A0A6G1IVP7_9PLEO|nr:hypothetical protein K458DRAFT_370106 [Lentithecium fluviatile CBS 122367]